MHHVKKARRGDEPAATAKPAPSNVFAPFRAIGTVCNDVATNLQTLGTEAFLTTCVGTAFHVYNVDKFRLMSASAQTPEPISAVGAFKETTFAACRNIVHVFKRGKRVGELAHPSIDGTIFQIMVLGDYVLALSDDNQLTVWVHASGEVYSSLEFGAAFSATCFMHPHTYLNKVLVGSSQGTMQIWNIKTGKLIYEFDPLGSAVTTIVQSPVIDVVAIGTLDGHIHLHNLKLDERIGRYHQEARVTALAFRSDKDASMLASANHQGDIAIWDLAKRRLVHQVKGAHDGLIPSMHFLNGQPLLVTSGADNAIKQFIFDSPDGVPRLLKFRSGHSQPPTQVRFYDEHGRTLITAAKDRALRTFSVVRDAQSTEMSQGAGTGTAAATGTHATKGAKRHGITLDQLRLPPVTSLAANPLTERDWDNVITAHDNHPEARTWSFRRKALGDHKLVATDGGAVKAVAMSGCGNFAVIGSAQGALDVYNMQSGQHRRTIAGHRKAVTGVVVDRINRFVVSSSLDATIKVWDFKTGKELYTLPVPAPVTQLACHADNELIAIVADDLAVRVFDLETRRIVREFWGHRNRITDVAFSPDGRWLVSASLDATVKTWDLPTGCLIDQFRVDHVVTSLAFSPHGDYLATTHVDNLAVFLWANRSQFVNLSLRPLTDEDEVTELALPSAAGEDDEAEAAAAALADADADGEGNAGDVVVAAEITYSDYVTPVQIAAQMVTLSTYPKSRWQSLLNLDSLKTRNKPKEPPKKPEMAPFFLPTVAGLMPTFAADGAKDNDVGSLGLNKLTLESDFTVLLQECDAKREYGVFLASLVDMGPAAIDLEIRMLSELHLGAFMRAMLEHVAARRTFELGQSWINVFLKCHGEALSRTPEVAGELQALLDALDAEWGRVQRELRYCNCLLDFVRN
ncbi:rRNA-processing protein utp21 [Blastocladiella emersonii ATCC 22665]|nr:rRNA-processing protein utp21 [Blastocladiella emersonii ATCC 22665]